MNIFSHLPGLGRGDDAGELTEAELKAERIDFHRRQVRNGPARFSSMTNGQIRRARKRAADRETKKNFKREVRQHFAMQRIAASVGSHLQIIGVLSFVHDREVPLTDQIASTVWIVQRFGREVEVDGVGAGHVSFQKDDVLAAIRAAATYYGKATGFTPEVSADFVPAIVLAEGVDA